MSAPVTSREGLFLTTHWPTSFNLPAGSEVKLKLRDGKSYSGTVLKNPADQLDNSVIGIVNVTDVDEDRPYGGALMFAANEISEFTVLHKKEPVSATALREKTMPTLLIRNCELLEMLLNALKTTTIKEIGVSLIGEGAPLSTISWILFSSHDAIIPIEVEKFRVNGWPLWEKLRPVFESRRILKIMHNLRPAIDYLYHTHGLRVENVYDTQLVDFVLSKKEAQARSGEPRKHMISLEDAVAKYLSGVVREKELQVLRNGKRDNSPATQRKYMALTVKYLIPLKEGIERVKNSRFTKLFEVYAEDVISSRYEDPNSWCRDDEPMENLNSTIRDVFSATQGGERQ